MPDPPTQERTYTIIPATTPTDLADIQTLFHTYAASLNISLTFQNADEEFSTLPGKYAPPTGILLLARQTTPPTHQKLGCIAVRKLTSTTCEMKRLYVSPLARGTGLGRELAVRAIEMARGIGYERMVLDTLPHMTPALKLYGSLGFARTGRYYDTPLEETVFMELDLKKGVTMG